MQNRELLEITFINMKLITIFVNIFRRKITTLFMLCVRLKYGDSQWTKILK